jgi:hypothetical protein
VCALIVKLLGMGVCVCLEAIGTLFVVKACNVGSNDGLKLASC